MIEKILLILLVLAYSSWTDYKTKEVSNKIIIIGLILSLIISLNDPTFYFKGLLFATLAFVALWKFGGFGAGDSKILILFSTLFGFIDTIILFILTSILFIFYNIVFKKQEKRLVPFILIAFVIKIIIYILVSS